MFIRNILRRSTPAGLSKVVQMWVSPVASDGPDGKWVPAYGRKKDPQVFLPFRAVVATRIKLKCVICRSYL